MIKTRFVKTIGLCLLAGFVCVAVAQAVDYYVAVDGNDANDGLTPVTAKHTIQAAVDTASDGDTVLVNDGVYELAATLVINKGVTVRSLNGCELTILDGMEARRCVEMDHATARLEGFAVRRGLADDDEGVDAGAGIHNEQGVVYECLITDNHALDAGGILNGPLGVVINSSISQNSAFNIAGGVWNEGIMSNCLVSANYVVGPGYAAGIYNEMGGIVQNCTVMSNGFGAGVGMTFYAGGIFNQEGVVRNCLIVHNKALVAGGVFNVDGLVEDCLIEHNQAETAGGVWNEGEALLQNSVVRYNMAMPWMGMGDGTAGGVYNGYDAEMRNCLVVGNQAFVGGGGVLSDGIMYNCTIVANQAGILAGGLANYDRVFNCIVWDNVAPTFSDVFLGESSGEMHYSCSPVVVEGVGNITNNPVLINPGSGSGTNHVYGDYRLNFGSPCVDAAFAANWMLQPDATDLDGNPRIIGGGPDIGTYEYLVPPTGLSASDGAFADRVSLTWRAPTPSPAYYEVWRATADDYTQAAWLADSASLSFYDTSAVPGVLYYYWIRSVVAGPGAFSVSDTGWRAILSPANLTAGAGQDTDAVCLDWDAVAGAVSYEIYRGITADFGAATGIGATPVPGWDDYDATPGVLYYYWVRAVGADFASVPGTVSGWRRSMASTHNAHGDFDGDGIMDLLVYNPRTGHWGIMLSSSGYKVASLQLGGPGCVPVPADYTGDGRTDPAVYRESNGEWNLFLRDGDFWRLEIRCFGGMGWQSVPGDYDGDGRTDLTVYQRGTGQWRALLSGAGYMEFGIDFGGTGWLPAPADYDGDGRTDPAVYDMATGEWSVMLSSHNYTVVRTAFGGTGWRPVPADYDGDGRADPAVYHGTTGEWSVLFSSEGYAVRSTMFGGGDWLPVPADYDGDGKADLAVYNLVTGEWSAMLSGSGYTVRGAMFGGTGWLPGAFY